MVFRETKLQPKKGWRVNPKAHVVLGILKGLKRTEGQCPCINDSKDIYCPCTNYKEKDKCCCQLYVKEENKCLNIIKRLLASLKSRMK